MSDSEMVERVAREIGKSFIPAFASLEANIYTFLRAIELEPDDADTQLELMLKAAAQAAIEAMRDPTDKMKAHEEIHWDYRCNYCGGHKFAWHTLIDEALRTSARS